MITGAISRSTLQTCVKTLEKTIEGGHLIEPQRMYDPDLVHPYGESPPGGESALADARFVLKKMDANPSAPNVEVLQATAADQASQHSRYAAFAALGVAACAVGGALGFAWLPAGQTIGQWLGVFGTGAAGCVAYGLSENKKAAEEGRFSELLDGWQNNIRHPQNLVPIPESDCMNAEYVMYVEGRYIGRRRAALP